MEKCIESQVSHFMRQHGIIDSRYPGNALGQITISSGAPFVYIFNHNEMPKDVNNEFAMSLYPEESLEEFNVEGIQKLITNVLELSPKNKDRIVGMSLYVNQLNQQPDITGGGDSAFSPLEHNFTLNLAIEQLIRRCPRAVGTERRKQMIEKLSEDCATLWMDGHRRCDQISLTGQLCHFAMHDLPNEKASAQSCLQDEKRPQKGHCSGVKTYSMCNCGLSQLRQREELVPIDPMTQEEAVMGKAFSGDDVGEEMDEHRRKERIESTEEDEECLDEEAEDELSKQTGEEESSRPITPAENVDYLESYDVYEHGKRRSDSTEQSEKGTFGRERTDDPKLLEKYKGRFLDHVPHSKSPPELLPLFPSFSVICIGHSSLYNHSTGIRESPNFRSGSEFLLPWSVQLTVRTEQWLRELQFIGATPTERTFRNLQHHRNYERSSNMTSKEKVKLFIGFDYECPRGHRFMIAEPGKVLRHRRMSGPLKTDAAPLMDNDLAIWMPCPCKKEPRMSAQLMRIHIVTPKAPVSVSVQPLIQMLNDDGFFFPGQRERIELGWAKYYVMRLPYVYKGPSGTTFHRPNLHEFRGKLLRREIVIPPNSENTKPSMEELNEGTEETSATGSLSSNTSSSASISVPESLRVEGSDECAIRRIPSALCSFVDPFCDPKKPVKTTFSDISSAAFNIRDGINRTPTIKSDAFSSMFDVELFFKQEYLQVTGSFKERGARFALMRLDKRAAAYHGHQLGIPVTVVMPKFAPLMKISCCESYNAKVILHGLHIQEAKIFAYELAKRENIKYINGFDNPDVIAGQGTIGLEILDQCLSSESEMCPSFKNAVEHRDEPLQPESSLADGLAVPTVGDNAVFMAEGLIDDLVTKAVVEGAGAVGLAAFISGKLDYLRGKRHDCIGGLAVDGRLIKFDIVVSDRPGGMAELTNEIGKTGASIKDLFHERAWLAANVYSVRIRVICETRGEAHVQELITHLGKKYKQARMIMKK
uniref:Nonsense-mediated mRNA decay factor SMG8 n=1 Tax=Globodera pallida TaxID=36090 RepID=A0A183BT03_GLOPA